MQMLIATTNMHKTKEIEKIFSYKNCTFSSLINHTNIPEAIENGETFLDNAIIKARHYYDHLQIPAIADDSGLVVPALNDEPGVYSARYAGENSNYIANNALLVKNMAHLEGDNRAAYFICVVVYYDGQNLISAEGKVHGTIIDQPRGDNGFGYDPLFLYHEKNKTFAELSSEEKNKVSHRSRALKQLKEKLTPIILKNS
jgi:XTP/dITP diphosphohydrolase